MGDLDFSDPNIETDNAPWSNNDKAITVGKELCDLQAYSSDDDDLNSKSTVSISDLQEYDKPQVDTSVGQLNIIKSTGVHIGNQCYYHGDVTIQQFVVNSKDVDKPESLPHGLAKAITIDGQLPPVIIQEKNKDAKSVLALLNWRHVLYGLIIIIILIALTTTLVLLTATENNAQDEEELSSNYSDRLVTRKYWLAMPERPGVKNYRIQPVDQVMVGHTAGSECTLTTACEALVRTLQADAFARGWSDISYNFFLGGDGNIYEGRGWDKQAAHTVCYNSITIGVAFMGNFVRDPPPKKQLDAFQILLNEGVSLGKLSADYKILLQKQVQATESPGAALIEILKKWSHWSETVPLNICNWDSEISENSSLRLYTREDWQAHESTETIKPLEVNPAPYVIICHTVGRNCSTFVDCSLIVRDIQYDHMNRGWGDLGMHFLVGGDGAAYTGLGWGKHGVHTIPFNRKSIAIYFMGNFMFQLPPKIQIRAAKLLIEEGVKMGKITKNYKLFAQKQVAATESPGAALIQDIKTWPHWGSYEPSDDAV